MEGNDEGSFAGYHHAYIKRRIFWLQFIGRGQSVGATVTIADGASVQIAKGAQSVVFEKGTDFTYGYADNELPGQVSLTVTPYRRWKAERRSCHRPYCNSKSSTACALSFTENADGKTFTAVIEEVEGAAWR